MIQWYPGHMAKAKREIQEALKNVDIIYMVLDARIPKGSFHDDLYELASHKPILYLYNKSSLADLSKLKGLNPENSLVIDALSRKNINKIDGLTRNLLKDYISRQQQRGYKTVSIKVMIIGIPNVGKSTLINALAKQKKASTNKMPGHTRRLDWTLIGNEVYLLDTPGVLFPKIKEERDGYHLALTGAVKEDILPKEKLAFYAFTFLKEHYPLYISRFYNIDALDALTFFETLGQKRGYLNEDEVDLNQSYTTFLNDLKEGKLGLVFYE